MEEETSFSDVSKKVIELSKKTGTNTKTLMDEFIRLEEKLFDQNYQTTKQFQFSKEFRSEALNQLENNYKKNTSTYKNE